MACYICGGSHTSVQCPNGPPPTIKIGSPHLVPHHPRNDYCESCGALWPCDEFLREALRRIGFKRRKQKTPAPGGGHVV